MVTRGLFWVLLLFFRARAQDGSHGFQPSFIYMSGSMVTAFLTGPADVFSIAESDNQTENYMDFPASTINTSTAATTISGGDEGLLPHVDCSGRNRTGDWSLNVTSQENVSIVTVRLTRRLQLCTSNLANCCVEPLCLLEALQVSACRASVVVARLLIQVEIYANTSLGNTAGKTDNNATVIPNQVFQPLGSCPCNLTAGACDIRCCCDLECTPEMKQLFDGSCFEGVFGGDVNPPFDQLCSVQAGRDAPDWFPFLCVQSPLNNTPFLGYFYHGAISPSQDSAFKIPFEKVSGKLLSGYKQGDPILTIQNQHFTVPQQFIAGQCARTAPVAFLQNFHAECLATCQEGGGMSLTVAINGGTGDIIEPQVTHERKTTDVTSCAGRECKNVTFAEDYTVIWDGKRIIEMKVTILSGEMCPEETLKQRFTVRFLSNSSTNAEELSGNPGYQVGKPIRAVNLNTSDAVTALKLWKPDDNGLCTSASLVPLLFGLNSVSGCILEVDLKENCSQLRENITERLNSLVPAGFVGKRGNSNSSDPDDWVEIIRLGAFGPATNGSAKNLKGTCLDIPAHLNIQIITADVGVIEGIPQQEILGVQISFSTVTWQVPCPILCEDKTSSLPISAAVQFIKIPAQPPVPMTRFQINYTEYDCKRNDVCWPELFYPMTRDYTGEPYSHSLAKGLVLAFFVLIAFVLSDPWRRFYKAWNKI